MIRSYSDLRVWQLGIELVEEVYLITGRFPCNEAHGLTNQLRRAAVSIPSNIAEGHAREHTKEYLHHLSIARSSLAEVETQIEIGVRLKYLSQGQATSLLEKSTSLTKQTNALRNALKNKG
jgi:four helix bundle protein